MALKNQVVDEWFKSLKFDPNAAKDDNNVELIEIKVAPISDLILDHEVAALYANMVGKHISYESNVMPRARNKVYAKIPVANLNRLQDQEDFHFLQLRRLSLNWMQHLPHLPPLHSLLKSERSLLGFPLLPGILLRFLE